MIGFVGQVGDFEVAAGGEEVVLFSRMSARSRLGASPTVVVGMLLRAQAEARQRAAPSGTVPILMRGASQAHERSTVTASGALAMRGASRNHVTTQPSGIVSILLRAEMKTKGQITEAVMILPIDMRIGSATRGRIAVQDGIPLPMTIRAVSRSKITPNLNADAPLLMRVPSNIHLGAGPLPGAAEMRILMPMVSHGQAHADGILPMPGAMMSAASRAQPGWTGAVGLNARASGVAGFRPGATYALALGLAVRAAIHARSHAEGLLPLVGRAGARFKAVAAITGAVAIAAAASGAAKGRAAVSAAAAILGRMQAASRSAARLTGVLPLAGRGAAMARGRPEVSAAAALASTVPARTSGRSHATGVLPLEARAESKTRALTADLRGPIFQLLARASARVAAKPFADFRATMLLRAKTSTAARIVVSLLRFTPNYVTTAAARNMIAGTERSLVATTNRNQIALADFRDLAAIALSRQRIALAEKPTMSQAPDFTPPIDATVEQEFVFFDFVNLLRTGITVTGILEVTCEVFSGADAAPGTRLIGAPAIVASPSCPDTAAAAVAQMIGGMLAGVTYRIQCVVELSDGQHPSLWSRITCQEPD